MTHPKHLKKILFIFGTRPEAIKMAPVILLLRKVQDLNVSVCVSAQHREMLDQVLDFFEIKPDYDLNVMLPGQDLFDVTSRTLTALRDVIEKDKPDLILVHGDTTTTMTASLASYYMHVPVGHIEAGLRTKNKYAPFPEEMNRRITGAITDIHFAPTNLAKQNLLKEGIPSDNIFVTGNTVIDALFLTASKISKNKSITNDLQKLLPFLKKKDKILLVTGHRRENFGEGMANICHALVELSNAFPELKIVYPAHLNPNVLKPVNDILVGAKRQNIHIIPPLDYLSFVYLMQRSHIILTDSGGVQEEAPSLGKPVLVMRDTTERPEAVDAGTVRLVGSNKYKIIQFVSALLNDHKKYEKMSEAHNPYGDGNASERICNILIRYTN